MHSIKFLPQPVQNLFLIFIGAFKLIPNTVPPLRQIANLHLSPAFLRAGNTYSPTLPTDSGGT